MLFDRLHPGLRKGLWFLGLWFGGVAVLGLIAYAIRWGLGL